MKRVDFTPYGFSVQTVGPATTLRVFSKHTCFHWFF
jgi:hypothetical protein